MQKTIESIIISLILIIMSGCTYQTDSEEYDAETADKFAERIENLDNFHQKEFVKMLKLYESGRDELLSHYKRIWEDELKKSAGKYSDEDIEERVRYEFSKYEVDYASVFVIFRRLRNADTYDLGRDNYERFKAEMDSYENQISEIRKEYKMRLENK